MTSGGGVYVWDGEPIREPRGMVGPDGEPWAERVSGAGACDRCQAVAPALYGVGYGDAGDGEPEADWRYCATCTRLILHASSVAGRITVPPLAVDTIGGPMLAGGMQYVGGRWVDHRGRVIEPPASPGAGAHRR